MQSTSGRIPTLDGWRGVAILTVLLDHYLGVYYASRYPYPRLAHVGYHGVGLFFVLSGFLITSLLLKEKRESGSIDLRRFYIRRAFRILPCAWAYLGVVLFAVLIWEGHAQAAAFARGEVASCLFFYRNYFTGHVVNIWATGHFWSLSIEEQFYLVWPPVLLLLGSRRSRNLAIIAILGAFVWRWLHVNQIWFGPFTYADHTPFWADALLLGCLAAITVEYWRAKLRPWMGGALLCFVVLCARHYHGFVPTQESAAMALMLLATASFPSTILGRILEWKPLVQLGHISYSLYIWQQLTVFFVQGHKAALFLCPVLAIFLAVLSYCCIEQPMIRLGKKLTQRLRQTVEREDRAGSEVGATEHG